MYEEGLGYIYLVPGDDDDGSKETCELADDVSTKSVCRDDEEMFANLFARLMIF